jgi:hypothetical protein
MTHHPRTVYQSVHDGPWFAITVAAGSTLAGYDFGRHPDRIVRDANTRYTDQPPGATR